MRFACKSATESPIDSCDLLRSLEMRSGLPYWSRLTTLFSSNTKSEYILPIIGSLLSVIGISLPCDDFDVDRASMLLVAFGLRPLVSEISLLNRLRISGMSFTPSARIPLPMTYSPLLSRRLPIRMARFSRKAPRLIIESASSLIFLDANLCSWVLPASLLNSPLSDMRSKRSTCVSTKYSMPKYASSIVGAFTVCPLRLLAASSCSCNLMYSSLNFR